VKIAIWGAGAVGLGLASALARPKGRLQILVRNDQAATSIGSRGILRTGLFGKIQVPPEQLDVLRLARSFAEDPPDWLLICTKAFSADEVARELSNFADRLTPVTRLLLCQNGWGNELPFLAFWPAERLFHARIITGFHRRGAHQVEITAHASAIALGNLYEGIERARASVDLLQPLSDLITEGGLPAETSDDMRSVLWAKMLYNCSLNPLGALAGRRYGELTSDPTTKALLEEVVREIFSVLAAADIDIDLAWPDADAYLETFYAELIPPTAAHESSMLQDLRAGNPTEIEALCGAVERLGTEHGVETPVTSALATLVRAAERGGRT
jgi:2-dehydropantoate 2-reductase